MQKQKTVEEIYQKKTPLQHILLRPDTYIGTVEPSKQAKWILPKDQIRFTHRQITFTPGFYKIFDEVLVNAADNYQRDKKMSQLKVNIDPERGSISVFNNGKGIPIVIHKEHKIYIPQLIFGHLLTGSNYNDDEKRIVGGRNGYGAKLANVFSDKFIVECGDSQNKKKFKMTWKNNMKIHDEGQITPYSGKDFVQVTFFPCFKLFNMPNGLDQEIIALMSKRVYDMAGILPKVKVSLNDKQIDVRSFSEYVDLYFEKDSSPTKIFDKEINTQRWEVIVSITDGQFKQVSFVNGVCTSKGGTHVNYLVDQIVEKVQDKIKKKQKDLNIKPFQIKAHIWIFVNCLIENPTFDTQTKETLTLKTSQFGSKCQLSDKIIKDFLKLGIVDTVIQIAKAKQMTKLAKTTAGQKKSKLTGIPKLEDANEAGTKNSQKCTLILTQGDSAKALAMSGLAVLGRDFYGVFPLKGKLLNVREANSKTLLANEEIQNLIKIIGLQIGKNYEDLKSLRYGAIMIMSDQDTDGSHIKGLVVNFIHHFWPSLFKMSGFVKQFITPLLKVFKGNNSIAFYTMNDFKSWAQSVENIKTWRIKYYKGLGTSTDKQARDYFQDLRKHKIQFLYVDRQDDEAIQLIFSKKKIEDRKNWLNGYDPNTTMVYDRPKIRYKEFVDCQFIHFSNEDNQRSIGSLIDGFKPGQRKILFGCFKRRLEKQIKVAQLTGYIAQNSAYHHGEMSLVETIVGMAQNFVGSNNVNLLMPNGQFGSRNLGGKDHASGRYIFTNLSRVARCLFPEPDDHTLTYVQDDGQIVEPQYYVPIIPMILVNGCQGIGTGWSTYIPNFNPRQICEIIKRKLTKGEQFPQIHPWYKNFTGQISPLSQDLSTYQVTGNLYIDEHKDNCIIINELPVARWTKDFKLGLDEIMNEGEDKIVGLREYHTKDRVHFQVEMNQQYFNKLYDGDGETFRLQKFFKIIGSMSLKNMVGFNAERRLVKMPNVKSILNMFYGIRLQYYEKRKDYLKSRIKRQLVQLQERERFILEVVEEKILIRNVKKIKICQTLKQRKFKRYTQLPKVKSTKIEGKPAKQQGEVKQGESDSQSQNQNDQRMNNSEAQLKKDVKQFNYLLDMPLWNLSYEKVEEIKEKRKIKQNQYDVLQKTSIEDMWINDIDEFLKVLDKVQEKQNADRKKQDEEMKKNIGKGKVQKAKKKVVKKQKKEKNGYDWDSEDQSQTGAFKDDLKKKPKASKKEGQFDTKKDQGKKMIKKEGKSKKQEKSATKPKKQDDDLLSRLKKKLSQAPDQYLTTKPVSKQLSIQEVFSNSKNKVQIEEQYDVVPNPNKIKKQADKKQKKKKMTYDSDEQEEDQYSEYDDGITEDEEDSDFE